MSKFPNFRMFELSSLLIPEFLTLESSNVNIVKSANSQIPEFLTLESSNVDIVPKFSSSQIFYWILKFFPISFDSSIPEFSIFKFDRNLERQPSVTSRLTRPREIKYSKINIQPSGDTSHSLFLSPDQFSSRFIIPRRGQQEGKRNAARSLRSRHVLL